MGRQYSVFFLRQKLASLNAALGFGRNHQHGAATSKSRKTCPCAETSIYQFPRVGLSESWSVGELVIGELNCRRVGLSATWLLASWFVGELSSYLHQGHWKCHRSIERIWLPIVTMALSRVVSDLFNVEKCGDLEIRVRGHSRSLKEVPFYWLGVVSY